ncbi:MAG: hypothetical protein R2705_06770 [Ilumatobacteraceae bacterium]
MLIPIDTLRRIETGEVDLAFRRWTKRAAKAGGTQQTAIGVLAIDAVDAIDLDDLTEDDARRAGNRDLAELRAFLEPKPGTVYRITLRLAGADPRIALRNDTDLDPTAIADLVARLDRMDARSAAGPWTRATLELIDAHPERRAPDLAAMVGRETAPFKLDVRKLKSLGLTESFKVGYRVSPRGRMILEHLRRERP